MILVDSSVWISLFRGDDTPQTRLMIFMLQREDETVRSSIDCLIATFCVEQGFHLLHSNHDFDSFERHLELRSVKG